MGRPMTWEGERVGFYFRLSLLDIEKLIKSGGVCEGKKIHRCGLGMDFFLSLIDHLSRQRRL